MNSQIAHGSTRPRLICVALILCAVVAVVSISSERRVFAATAAGTPEERAVLEPIQGLFDGMAKADKSMIAAQMMPEGTATLFRNGQFVQMTLSALVDRLAKIISGPDKFEESIHDPLIHIDDNLAEVWAPYKALRNGKVDHCGTNVFILVRQDGHWLIASVADTFRTNCAMQ